ncbi:MAG: hypothetical protein WEC41_04830 [Dongiaceae bacterium]
MSIRNAVAPDLEPDAALARFLYKLRRQGLGYLWRRLRWEAALPTTRPGKAAHALMRGALAAALTPIRALRGAAAGVAPGAAETLYAFYDLKVAPVTYDILWFLAAADLERRRLGLARVHVVIVPGPFQGVREEDELYERAVDAEARRWRIDNILVPACRLLPACAGLTLAGTRAETAHIRSHIARHVYPVGYETALPLAHHPKHSLRPAEAGVRPIGVLRASEAALRYVDRWLAPRLEGRRLVTITLRDYAYYPARNSNLAAWIEFARRLDRGLYFPVFVLDTERSFDLPSPAADLPVFRTVSWNLGLRMALYERAWLNLGVGSGPVGLCWFNDTTRYLTFKILTPEVPQTTLRFARWCGFEPDRSLPFATPLQRWVWEDDSVETIEREFAAMAALIDAAEAPAPRP